MGKITLQSLYEYGTKKSGKTLFFLYKYMVGDMKVDYRPRDVNRFFKTFNKIFNILKLYFVKLCFF